MLRTDRPRDPFDSVEELRAVTAPRDLILALAPPPRPPSFFLSGWPNWLIPAYRSGGHGPAVRLLEEVDE